MRPIGLWNHESSIKRNKKIQKISNATESSSTPIVPVPVVIHKKKVPFVEPSLIYLGTGVHGQILHTCFNSPILHEVEPSLTCDKITCPVKLEEEQEESFYEVNTQQLLSKRAFRCPWNDFLHTRFGRGVFFNVL